MSDDNTSYQNHKRHYVKRDDPTRCQGIQMNGEQCVYGAMPESLYCTRHTTGLKQREQRMYQLTKWKNRVAGLAGHEHIYTLTEEIGVTRMVLEETLNKCKNEVDLMQHAPAIGRLVDQVSRLVASSVALEDKLNRLLSATKVAAFMERTIAAVKNVVDSLDLPTEKRDAVLEQMAAELEAAFEDVSKLLGDED